MRRLAALSLVLLASCGSPPTPAYVRENEAAQTAKRRGDHAQAAAHYERAAALSGKPRDADEARYRAAQSYARAGDTARARALYTRLAAGGSDTERATRAEFELAQLLIDGGREAEGRAQLESAIRRHPGSGLARAALERRLTELQQQSGPEAALIYLERQRAALDASELAETVSYRKARALDDAGKRAEARDQYLACAERFPYPKGAFWDDALFRAAEKELELGAPERAIAHLRRMLAEQESAIFVGSYERGRYAEAQLKLGEIYRDVLHDPARARSEFRKVWANHPTSRLVDDALFQEALVARAAGDQAGTCAPLSILVSKLPQSRYAACAPLLCQSLAQARGDCHDYIRRAAGLP
jgi:tetratricopeptide (TPR) repeat protein